MPIDNIIHEAFVITQAVDRLKEKVRHFFYQVILMGHSCPECRAKIEMVADNWCHCRLCGHEFDPTQQFQRCSCGGHLKIQVRRYICQDCGTVCGSRFAFDSVVYDREYFAEKMRESRNRKAQKGIDRSSTISQQRSDNMKYCAAEISSVPGLISALDSLTGSINTASMLELRKRFDLNKYQRHIIKYIDSDPIDLKTIPAIEENSKLDIIWKFVAIIFLEHEGKIVISQINNEIFVSKNDVNRKRQDISFEAERSD